MFPKHVLVMELVVLVDRGHFDGAVEGNKMLFLKNPINPLRRLRKKLFINPRKYPIKTLCHRDLATWESSSAEVPFSSPSFTLIRGM